jgi:hypothetical protein
MVEKMDPAAAKQFLASAQQQVHANWKKYENLAGLEYSEE